MAVEPMMMMMTDFENALDKILFSIESGRVSHLDMIIKLH
jgi:hypothetical protein